MAACRKTCFPQIVLLQYRAKPYLLGFQNLGCHCKILECHFDAQTRLKKYWVALYDETKVAVRLGLPPDGITNYGIIDTKQQPQQN